MNSSVKVVTGLLFTAAALAVNPKSTLAQASSARVATPKSPVSSVPTRVFHDDNKVRVQEVTFRPGDVGANSPRPFRVIRVLEGGTLQRTYPDGRTEKIEFRPGEVKVFPADPPFALTNVGPTTVVLYVVALKEAK